MYIVSIPAAASHSFTAPAVNSEPLSLRIAPGSPWICTSSASTRTTLFAVMLRPTSIRRHSRVNSSSTTRSLSFRPSLVSSCTKSYVHTWFGCSARRTEHAFALVPERSFFLSGRTTFSPATFQSRCTRFTFTPPPPLLTRRPPPLQPPPLPEPVPPLHVHLHALFPQQRPDEAVAVRRALRRELPH